MLFGMRSALGAAVLVAAALALMGVNPMLRGVPGAKVAEANRAPPPTPVTGQQALPAGNASTSEAETSHEQAQRLMKAVDAILQDVARNRSEARKLPADADFMLKPIWAETKEDRERKVRPPRALADPDVQVHERQREARRSSHGPDDRDPVHRSAPRLPGGTRPRLGA